MQSINLFKENYIMSRIIRVGILLLVMSLIVSNILSCENTAKEIAELEQTIEELNDEIRGLESDLKEWEELCNDAKDAYYQYGYSNSGAIQQELERTKKIIKDAEKEVGELQREIRYLENRKERAEARLELLKSK